MPDWRPLPCCDISCHKHLLHQCVILRWFPHLEGRLLQALYPFFFPNFHIAANIFFINQFAESFKICDPFFIKSLFLYEKCRLIPQMVLQQCFARGRFIFRIIVNSHAQLTSALGGVYLLGYRSYTSSGLKRCASFEEISHFNRTDLVSDQMAQLENIVRVVLGQCVTISFHLLLPTDALRLSRNDADVFW